MSNKCGKEICVGKILSKNCLSKSQRKLSEINCQRKLPRKKFVENNCPREFVIKNLLSQISIKKVLPKINSDTKLNKTVKQISAWKIFYEKHCQRNYKCFFCQKVKTILAKRNSVRKNCTKNNCHKRFCPKLFQKKSHKCPPNINSVRKKSVKTNFQ